MADLLGGVRSFQHRRVRVRHSALVVPPLFPCQGTLIYMYIFFHILGR